MSGPCGADSVDNLKQQADAVFEAASIGIGALVGDGREELMKQVAVSGVDFKEVKASGEGTLGAGGEGMDEGVDAGLIQCLGDGVVGCKGDRAGPDGLPSAFRGGKQFIADEGRGDAGFASGVGELNAAPDSLTVDEFDDAREAVNVLVLVDSEVVGGDAAFGNDGGGLKHDEAGAPLRASAEVNHVPVVGKAVLRGVLAHGRDADAVGEGDRTELKGRKQRMAHE